MAQTSGIAAAAGTRLALQWILVTLTNLFLNLSVEALWVLHHRHMLISTEKLGQTHWRPPKLAVLTPELVQAQEPNML